MQQRFELPSFSAEHAALTPDERRRLMVVRDGHSDDAPVEAFLRDVFVWAILTNASDVHVSGRGDRQNPSVQIGVRSPKQLINFPYTGSNGRHFEVKLFQLTATPHGGSTPDTLSTRFSIELPARVARKHGLITKQDRHGRDLPYVVGIRVGYVRTYDGFAFVCRLLDEQRRMQLIDLGLSYALLRTVQRALAEPSGLVLVSGPTGSGKTTLLYSLLDQLNDGQRVIVTIENPVEYQLDPVGPSKQIEVKGDITFARALRETLRLDPDVILIGEIRDAETMEVALQAAQTGHLVFATLHANSGTETLSRALDLTMDKRRDAFRLAETVKLVLATRLIDRYDGVQRTRPVAHDEHAWLSVNGIGFVDEIAELQSGTKCGKAALVEAFAMSPAIKQAVRSTDLNSSEVYRLACEQLQYETLASAGVRAVQALGASLKDCMNRLESTTDAAATPGYRARLAAEHRLTLAQVAEAVDAFCAAEDGGRPQPIEVFVDQVREAKCAVDTL
jgi:type II secretory ATPase GspE/PulE/Tfp pilus assembly ATPase PilB-like protein